MASSSINENTKAIESTGPVLFTQIFPKFETFVSSTARQGLPSIRPMQIVDKLLFPVASKRAVSPHQFLAVLPLKLGNCVVRD